MTAEYSFGAEWREYGNDKHKVSVLIVLDVEGGAGGRLVSISRFILTWIVCNLCSETDDGPK